MPLTREDLRALRTADDIHFHSHEGRHWIVAGIDGSVHTKSQQELFPIIGQYSSSRCREIDVDSAQCYDYLSGRGTFSAFADQWDRAVLRTVTSNLKAGDELKFVWYRNNNSPTLDRAGLVRDTFKLDASSDSWDKDHRRWNIEERVCQDNSARMVRIP